MYHSRSQAPEGHPKGRSPGHWLSLCTLNTHWLEKQVASCWQWEMLCIKLDISSCPPLPHCSSHVHRGHEWFCDSPEHWAQWDPSPSPAGAQEFLSAPHAPHAWPSPSSSSPAPHITGVTLFVWGYNLEWPRGHQPPPSRERLGAASASPHSGMADMQCLPAESKPVTPLPPPTSPPPFSSALIYPAST